jgi:hypothetical protein
MSPLRRELFDHLWSYTPNIGYEIEPGDQDLLAQYLHSEVNDAEVAHAVQAARTLDRLTGGNRDFGSRVHALHRAGSSASRAR